MKARLAKIVTAGILAVALNGQAAPAQTRQLLFRDEFDKFRIWDGTRGWDIFGGPQWRNAGRVRGQGTEPFNYELGWYLNPDYRPRTVEPFNLRNGRLAIRAIPYEQVTWFDTFPYTSGMINSNREFTTRYGYIEMRAKLASGPGFFPAFWLLPADGTSGEIDIMEVLGNDPTKLYTTVHSYSSGHLISTGRTTTIPNAAEDFHTYGVDWQADFITWYFDGRRVFRTRTPDDVKRPMYIIVNLAVGGNWPGVPDDGSRAAIEIDYIRAYNGKPN